ncbi:MAG: rhodanese-like domain-containing protein [Saprospiraceae bacterium]
MFHIEEVTAQQLKGWQNEGRSFQLIDVREVHEYEQFNIGGELIPLGSIASSLSKINIEGDVVVHCLSGARSANAIMHLQSMGYKNIFNLSGGIMAYVKENGSPD